MTRSHGHGLTAPINGKSYFRLLERYAKTYTRQREKEIFHRGDSRMNDYDEKTRPKSPEKKPHLVTPMGLRSSQQGQGTFLSERNDSFRLPYGRMRAERSSSEEEAPVIIAGKQEALASYRCRCFPRHPGNGDRAPERTHSPTYSEVGA